METLELLGVALGLGALAGINLYLTVFVTGLAIRLQWITLAPQYEQLAILGEPAIVILAGVLYFFEFFADKVPWVDSLWDSIHTVIRPVGGALIAVQVLGESNPVFGVAVGLLAGGMALTTHAVKASSRLVVNSSPEPFSNIAISTAEDVVVLGGLWLIGSNPAVALVVALLVAGTALWFAPKLVRGAWVKLWLIWRKLNLPATNSDPIQLTSKLPSQADILLSKLNPENRPVAWAVRCICGRSSKIPSCVSGWLVALEGEEKRLRFLGPRGWMPVAERLDLEGWKVSLEPGFLSDNLVLYMPDRGRGKRHLFLFDRPRGELARQVAAKLEAELGPEPSAGNGEEEIAGAGAHAAISG